MPLLIGGVIGGSALLGAGGSLWSGLIQRGAAQTAANVQSDAYFNARQQLNSAQGNALAYLDPFRQYGLNAGSALQSLIYSPEQMQGVIDSQRAQLQGEVDRLKAALPVWEQFPIFTGKNASERRASAFTEQLNTGQQALRQAQAKLDTFNKQAEGMLARSGQGAKPQASPWYQFQSELLGRNMDRFFAARGLTGSGFEAEERRRGLIELGAGETERQYNRLAGLYNTGANAASQGANVLTNTASQIANAQIGQGQAEAGGILRSADATSNMISGVSNAITGAAAQGLNFSMFKDLMNRNSGYGAAGIGTGAGTFTVGPQGPGGWQPLSDGYSGR